MLPDPPPTLPDAPAAFYAALREAVPADLEAVEVDFGDSGIGVAFAGGLGAQVSRRAAVAFDADATAHFDERADGWAQAAAAWVADRV